jgi:hypothetical protein
MISAGDAPLAESGAKSGRKLGKTAANAYI